ncbi:uncharacterized protein UBRO_03275 [Ustilago bromivora]|uniref:Uncharacterized protein n=1 Tax=Ustilago bromivora TaxID=307758 RepID=A0A1K0G2L9_9BASI|nr:uncharacterized protein UBRO_03275 [Ustilago bromivora]SYW83216.1 uncharacterized protein UBRO2_05107 [Ustilago bromivora]
MTDNEPRQLLPEIESHQNLSTKLGASRPLPPKKRSNRTVSSVAKSSNLTTETSDTNQGSVGIDPIDDSQLETCHDSQATAKSHDEERADLEARGTASPVRMTVQRAVSGASIRSSRPNTMVSEIPKEEIEEALQGLDRDDLVVALGRAKVQMDEIEAQLAQQVLENETLHDTAASLTQQLGEAESRVYSLHSIVKQREERIDELMSEQERMEGEVYSTMQVIERLRKQLSETERSRNDAEKRYLDQTATMDKERQYYQDTEALLKSQKATQASAYEKLLSGHNELLREHERLTNRLASIKSNGGDTQDVASSFDPPSLHFTGASDASLDSQTTESHHNGKGASDHGDRSPPRRVRKNASKVSTFSEETDMAALVEELSTLQKSHSSLSETMATLQTELKDVRAENVTLRDQNETFMDILQEKTFSGALLNESAMLRGIRRASLGRLRAQGGLDDPYDDDYSTGTDMQDVGDDDDDDDEADDRDKSRGTSISSGTIPEEDEDDVDDVPDTPKAPPKQVKSSQRRRTSSSAAQQATTDLASELEGTTTGVLTSPADKSSRETRSSQRLGVVSDDLEELQKEVRELREANQALTLYISKIIDRIIAREGYENILAVESRGTIRGPRHKASRARLDQSKEVGTDNKAGSRTVSNASNTSNASGSSQTGGLFSFGSSANQNSAASSGARAAVSSKSKRTSSIDWRNLPFLGGGGNASNPPEQSSNLRPLTLQSDSLLIPPREGSARKLRTSEEIEDENDILEREHIRQELLMRGIQPPKHQLVQSPNSPRKKRPQSVSAVSGAGGFAAFFSRVVGGATSNHVLSPTRSDSQSQASNTPVRSLDTNFERTTSLTPATESGNRDEERSRALQLSAGGGSSFTKLRGSQGVASKARQLRAERHQQTLDLTADTSSGYPFPSSSQSSTSNSRATSGINSLADSSIMESSIAGDESYSLPAPPTKSALLNGETDRINSPLAGYGGTLPPLPHETTGDEDRQAFRSPTTSQTSQDQGWKRAFRRFSLLGATSPGSQPNANDQDPNSQGVSPAASERGRSPLAATVTLPSIDTDADK